MRRMGLGTGAVAALIAAAALACSAKTETADNACSPLADPAARVLDEAATPEGRHVVVVGSAGGPASRIFYGPPDHLTEGRITGTAAGCFSAVSFVVDGQSFTATFGYAVCSGMIRSRLEPTDPGEAQQPLTLLVGPNGFPAPGAGAPAAAPSSFYCF